MLLVRFLPDKNLIHQPEKKKKICTITNLKNQTIAKGTIRKTMKQYKKGQLSSINMLTEGIN
jgi:hypothetical protein